MDANNLTAALTTRLLDDSGVERVSASIGQIHYFSPQKVLGTDWTGSAYVAQLDVQLSDRWRLNSSYQWSPNTRLTDMAAVELQRRWAPTASSTSRTAIVAGCWNNTAHPRSTRYPNAGAWWDRGLTRSWTARPSMPWLAWNTTAAACRCGWSIATMSTRVTTVSARFPPGSNINHRDNAIMFEVVFKGLGSSGGQIDPLLRRDILGYQ
jgi:Organic solvent tolerance protein OstA